MAYAYMACNYYYQLLFLNNIQLPDYVNLLTSYEFNFILIKYVKLYNSVVKVLFRPP